MSLVTTTNFRRAILSLIQANLDTYFLNIYVNNHTPVVTDVTADYTPPAGAWYSPIALTMWGAAFVNGSNQGEIDEIIRTWTVGAGAVVESVYGYYVTDGGGLLVWAELNPAGPQPMSVVGQTYSVLARLLEGDLC